MKPIDVLLVGAGGFGGYHVNVLLQNLHRGDYRFVGVVDPFVKQADSYEKLTAAEIPCYDTMAEFFAEHQAELTLISTPIALHAPQAIEALSHGSHVLCEKPLTATMENLRAMEAAAKKAGRLLAVGFQWSYTDAMLRIKEKILSGEFGRPISMKTLVCWPRYWKYFRRGWAGKRFAPDGTPIYDSIAANAAAHYIHNMFFLLGDSLASARGLPCVEAGLYRANDIENFDTIVFRGETDTGCQVFYAASHAVDYKIDPTFVYTFEKATVTYNLFAENQCVIHYADGRVETLGDINDTNENKLFHTLEVIRGEREPSCLPRTAAPHVALIEALAKEAPIHPLPGVVRDKAEELTYRPGLHLDLYRCFETMSLPSELGFDWAKAETEIRPEEV